VQADPSPVSDAGERRPGSLLVVGTGAMACLFAARLAGAGIRVILLGTWQEGLVALQEHGVRVVEDDGMERAYPVNATSDPRDCAGSTHALVLVKSWQTERAAEQLARCLSPDGLALTLQNGLGNRETLVRFLGASRVALGVTTSGATLLGPGQVRPGGQGGIVLGDHPRLGPLASLLGRAGFSLETVSRADDLLWSKLVVNAAINPLTALLRVPNGELLMRPSARTLMASAALEVAEVASALGLHLIDPDPVAAAEAVARRTALNHSSMFQDAVRGAPTEIDAICGAVVSTGERCGVHTPVNRTLWLLVKALGEKGDSRCEP
jgi:2-dehydropantoate 2-reductase